MNLFDIATINRIPAWQRTIIDRQARIKREGSESFNYNVPATAAGNTVRIELRSQFPKAKKYLPLDYIEIANNDTVDVELQINDKEKRYIPAGVIRQIRNFNIWQIGILNLDAAAASTLGKILITMRREPLTTDKYIREKA